MDELDPKTEGISPPDEEESVRRLLEMAGPRPPIPQEDLDAISNAARFAWQMQVRQQAAARAQRRHLPPRTLLLPLAAALAVAIGLALWWALRDSRVLPAAAWVEAVAGPVHLGSEAGEMAKGDPVPLGVALRSGHGDAPGRAVLRLAGGTTVRLDTDTRLRFVSAAALELERGAVYVDTGSARPSPSRTAIEVRTALGTARDVGTRFAVRIMDSASGVLLVRVRDGAVLTESGGRAYLTPAGQELALRRDGRAERSPLALHGSEWGWVLEASPGFDIEGRSLQELLAWVSRETGWQIRFADEGLAASAEGIVLHGSIGDLRPDRAPFAVLPGAGLEGELQGGTLIVRRRR